MVMETYALLPAFLASKNVSDKEWDSILAQETALLSVFIKGDDSQQAQQLEERAAERIACEIGAKGIAMHYHRKILDGLLAEFGRLRWGQITNPGKEGQLPNATRALPDEIQWSYDSSVISMDGIAVARFQGAYNASDAPSAPLVRADDVPETAD